MTDHISLKHTLNVFQAIVLKPLGSTYTMSEKIKYLIEGPKNPKQTIILAHGAGAPMDSDWMNSVAAYLAEADIRTARFEFPYMVERRETGKKRPPNPQKVLLGTWSQAVADWNCENKLFLSGKSIGGRMASLMADNAKGVAGVICFGFPFHALGKPTNNRIDHLKTLKTKTLIIQGTRDTMGTQEEVAEYELSEAVQLHWLEDGDHSFKPRKKSGFTQEQHIESACQAAIKFMRG